MANSATLSDMPEIVKLRRPDDWHVHLRDGAMLEAVLPATAAVFGRAIVMPNLDPPITTADAALAYRDRIFAALPDSLPFNPLMTCYLTDRTDTGDLRRGCEEGIFAAVKLYPAGATFQSAHGVSEIRNIYPALEVMQQIGLPLCVHGEVAGPEVDIFDREAVFIDTVLEPLHQDFPQLRIVFEHVTTEEAVDYVQTHAEHIAATITPHHLMINRNALFDGGIRPHYYCLPVAKRERHRQALRKAATSGDKRFFLGTDSAPHEIDTKQSDCGCAGIFNTPVAMACYAQVFDEESALDHFEAFAALNGPAFYGLAPNSDFITLEKGETPLEAASPLASAGARVEVFAPPGGLFWRML